MSRGPPKAYHEQTKKNRRTLGFVGIFSVIVVTFRRVNKNFYFQIKGRKYPPLFFNNREILTVNEHKHLGLTLDTQVLFTKHITGKGVIRYLSLYVPINTLDQLYKMYV